MEHVMYSYVIGTRHSDGFFLHITSTERCSKFLSCETSTSIGLFKPSFSIAYNSVFLMETSMTSQNTMDNYMDQSILVNSSNKLSRFEIPSKRLTKLENSATEVLTKDQSAEGIC